ncbi:lysoplasmalogenase [Micromonospora sp. WMMA1363]|uniref:lysoplasmalogenase n=1 Tax=Micromonospora sp. WMMA1363 TaxID=3053985 RepID=UPI00259CBB4A|nr:lysoplasmalogenase [Micromonospora sp. WMMA1363]MDM4719888.1 lysoplasmalogenase [Micromonospora sp. WMMA1363]
MPSRRALLVAFAVVTTGNLVANATGDATGELLTKPLLMPLLAAYLWRCGADRGGRPDRLILAALAFSTGGDVALLGDGDAFLVGMALFLAAHLCYVAAFTRGGAARLLRPPLVAVWVGYATLTVAALGWVWPGLADAGLALPVAGYAVALATMAGTAAAHGWRVGLGGALFLGSDLLIATGIAGVGTVPGPPIWVMASYAAGQALIVTGWAARGSTPTAFTPAAASAAP